MIWEKRKGEVMKKVVEIAHDILVAYIGEEEICTDFTKG